MKMKAAVMVPAGAERIAAVDLNAGKLPLAREPGATGTFLAGFIALYQRGKLPVHTLRSGFVTFDQINEGFDKLADGAVPRQVSRPRA